MIQVEAAFERAGLGHLSIRTRACVSVRLQQREGGPVRHDRVPDFGLLTGPERAELLSRDIIPSTLL